MASVLYTAAQQRIDYWSTRDYLTLRDQCRVLPPSPAQHSAPGLGFQQLHQQLHAPEPVWLEILLSHSSVALYAGRAWLPRTSVMATREHLSPQEMAQLANAAGPDLLARYLAIDHKLAVD